jgi:hypothetical protein
MRHGHALRAGRNMTVTVRKGIVIVQRSMCSHAGERGRVVFEWGEGYRMTRSKGTAPSTG